LWSIGVELPAPAHWIDSASVSPSPDRVEA